MTAVKDTVLVRYDLPLSTSWLIGHGNLLTKEVKLTDFGGASTVLSKEDERSARLAERAQKGDYDDGRFLVDFY